MTDFKEYLRSRKHDDDMGHDGAVSSAKVAVEWSLLKERVRALSAHETYKGEAFEWAPYTAAYADFVSLKNVAAIFRESRSLPDTPFSCEVLFGLRPLAANQVWSVEEAPTAQSGIGAPPKRARHRRAKNAQKPNHGSARQRDSYYAGQYFNEYEDFYRTGQCSMRRRSFGSSGRGCQAFQAATRSCTSANSSAVIRSPIICRFAAYFS